MREIKFRVFTAVKDDDGCVGYLETRSPVASGVDFFYDAGWRDIGYFLQHPDTFVVEQFTGLVDKNGKEIYEGDIVKYDNEHPMWEPETMVVAFEDGCFCFKGMASSQSDASFYEIIGNIFENPDLVEL